MKKIFILSLMESATDQLGNVKVFESTIRSLKHYIPDSKISTTILLTNEFCQTYNFVNVVHTRVFLHYDSVRKLLVSFFSLLRVYLWKFFKKFLHININLLIKGKWLKNFINSDVVLDLNGDIFPNDMKNPLRLLAHVIDILTIRQLEIPVVEFANSPGPFNNCFTRIISKIVFNRVNIILNREPISSELLEQIGIKKTPIINTACPAFLIEPTVPKKTKTILAQENINIKSRPLIGITLCGYNLPSQHTWGSIKNFNDLSLFIPTIKYLLNDLNAIIFLLPHVYRANPYTRTHESINGPDYDICNYLFRSIDKHKKYKGKIKLIGGKYTASEAKGIIGQSDLYISGRLHAGVAALSQAVPTILISYGHKHKGFARLMNQEKYVYTKQNPNELTLLVKNAWENRTKIKKTLEQRIVSVKKLANLNFIIVKYIINLDKEKRNNIPKHVLNDWIKTSSILRQIKND